MADKFFDWVMNRADLLTEPTPGKTLFEVVGSNRVLVENHSGVTGYDKSRVCVKTTYGLVCFSGNCLELTYMSKQRLIITGCIDCISLLRGTK